MLTSFENQRFAQQGASVFHPISTADKIAMAGLRAIIEPNRGSLRGTAARAPFDAIMEHVTVPEDVIFERGTLHYKVTIFSLNRVTALPRAISSRSFPLSPDNS